MIPVPLPPFGREMGLSSDLLLKLKKFPGVKEIHHRDPKAVAQHLDGDNAGIPAFSVQDIKQ